MSLACMLVLMCASLFAAEDSAPNAPAPAPSRSDELGMRGQVPSVSAESLQTFYIQEFQIEGASSLLTQAEIEEAVYPYLGPYRTVKDARDAAAALEKAYQDKGYQTVVVQIPPKAFKDGVFTLKVVEGQVGRLRVKGSRYFSLTDVKNDAPSLSEGRVPNFNEVSKDLYSLNRLSDRRISPSFAPGKEPGTIDVDLNVKDTYPLHGSMELNNRYSADTKPLRVNTSLSYSNLWQMGHTLGASFQISPENEKDSKVYSGYYSAPVPDVDWLTVMLQASKTESNVNTLGTFNTVGRGETFGPRFVFTLPSKSGFYHSITLGVDYKSYKEDLSIGGSDSILTPIVYYPVSIAYSSTWIGNGYATAFNSTVTTAIRGAGSDTTEFDNKRFYASENFIYLRSDVSHTQDMYWGSQFFAHLQGQVSGEPLISNEQFSGGGLDTARGYLESEASGDNAFFGTVEIRTPSITQWLDIEKSEWRFYIFGDTGVLGINKPLAEQDSTFHLASTGVGTRMRLWDHFGGSLDFGIPLLNRERTDRYDPRFTFRVWSEF